ncbi:hypothetical protein IQ06DRAFT_143129 [Phaeosphaeriaceae sp. SRC1lsM3a]|nr:hypothetical protein IQ06DRAFT_143129 [Stagonospora sp. SRC1lsM3a]
MHSTRLAARRFVPPACARLAAKQPYSWPLILPRPNPAPTDKRSRRHAASFAADAPKAHCSHADQTNQASQPSRAVVRHRKHADHISMLSLTDPITQTVCNFAQQKLAAGARDCGSDTTSPEVWSAFLLFTLRASDILSQDTGLQWSQRICSRLSQGRRSRNPWLNFFFLP